MAATEQSYQQIRACLDRVLSSPGFTHSEHICRFLRHCVERAMEQRPDLLKETSIGMDVFDRGSSFDPRTDTIVRVEARRLRQKLEEYYRLHGASDPIEIHFTPGSYVPAFLERVVTAPAKPAASKRLSSLAVLPFWNIQGDPDVEHFCDGLTEELITTLAHLRGLHVVARTSVFQFKGKPCDAREVGKLLNVEAVVEGSVRKSDNLIRVAVQLIDAADGCHLWSGSFDRELRNSFSLQEELAQSICSALREQLTDNLA
jgi:serine/threonine-protein kinase